MKTRFISVLLGLMSVVFSGCMVGPKYVKPTTPLAPAFKEQSAGMSQSGSEWKTATPSDGRSAATGGGLRRSATQCSGRAGHLGQPESESGRRQAARGPSDDSLQSCFSLSDDLDSAKHEQRKALCEPAIFPFVTGKQWKRRFQPAIRSFL